MNILGSLSKINVALLAILIVFFSTGCGGGGGKPAASVSLPPIQVEPKPTFSLTLRQQTSCDDKAVLPNTKIIVYDESPLTQYDTSFVSYTTNNDGLLELDIPEDSKISFSIISTTAIGDTKVYTFVDLDAGDYDLTALFYTESELEETCSCIGTSFNAVLNVNDTIDNISYVKASWGSGLKGYIVEYTDKIEFKNVDLCGTAHLSSPLAVIVYTKDGEKYYGFKDANAAQDLATPVGIDFSVDRAPKPLKGSDYSVTSAKILKSILFFYDYSIKSEVVYASYPEFTEAPAMFILESEISATYDEQQSTNEKSVVGLKSIRMTTNDDIIDGFPDFSSATYIDIIIDEENRLVSKDTDAPVFQQGISHIYSRYITSTGNRLRWYIYAPNNFEMSLPLLDEDTELMLSEGELETRYSDIINVNNQPDFTSSILQRRFNNPNTGVQNNTYDESYTRIVFRNNTISKNKTEPKNNEIEEVFYR